MTEKLDLSGLATYDPYVKVPLPILGKREVTRKEDGKVFNVVVCDDKGYEVTLFDWGLATRNGDLYVLKKHLKSAQDQARAIA